MNDMGKTKIFLFISYCSNLGRGRNHQMKLMGSSFRAERIKIILHIMRITLGTYSRYNGGQLTEETSEIVRDLWMDLLLAS